MSAHPMAEGEIEREARRVLRKLTGEGARLAATDGGYAFVPARRGGKQRARVSQDVADAFLRRGWLGKQSASGDLVLSDAGRGWIERALAESDPFAAQHRLVRRGEIMDAAGTARAVTINDGESPLGWLYRRRGSDGAPLISKVQFEAGERLRADFTLAQLSPRMTVDFTAPVVAGRRGAKPQEVPAIALAAKQRFTRALAAVGPGLSDILIDVCCFLTGLEEAERRKGWPQRTAKVVLLLALDRLVLHYGLGPVVGMGSRLRAWTAPDEAAGEDAAREP